MLGAMRLLASLLLSALFLTACAGPGGTARKLEPAAELEPGTLLTPAGEALGPDQLAAAVADARYVLVGEGHDSACDHRVQAAIVRALSARAPVVGLEMVSTERQDVLDRFHAGEVTVEELDGALGWEKKWGVPFALYRPIFDEAAAAQLPVAALNVPAEVVRQVSREGESALPPEVPALLPPPPEQEEMLRTAYESHAHGAQPSEEGFARFLRVQSLWDTAMAGAAKTWSRRLDRPVVVLAGAGHVSHGWGIGHRLAQLDPGAGIVEVVPWRGAEAIDPAAGDFFFYCPREER